jgi:hypothetical protein
MRSVADGVAVHEKVYVHFGSVGLKEKIGRNIVPIKNSVSPQNCVLGDRALRDKRPTTHHELPSSVSNPCDDPSVARVITKAT